MEEFDHNDEPNENGTSLDEIEIEENDDQYYALDEDDRELDEQPIIDIEDKSVITFGEHSKSVFSCDLSSDGNLAVSGGEDDKAYVWRTTDSSLLFECTGHQDSVIVAKFNCDSKYIATGDMKGIIKIWATQTGELVNEYEMEELVWLEWHPVLDNVFLYGTSQGNCYLNKISNESELKILPGNTSTSNGLFLVDGRRALVGYENGDVRLWQLRNCSTEFCIKETDQSNQVTALSIRSDDSIAAVGYLNSNLKIIHLTTGRKLFEHTSDNVENSVESIAFCSSLSILAVGYLEGEIDLWCLNAFTKRGTLKLSFGGVTKLLFDKEQPHILFASSTKGELCAYDIRDLRLLNDYSGHVSTVLDFTISKQNNFILSCSDDTMCKLFKIA